MYMFFFSIIPFPERVGSSGSTGGPSAGRPERRARRPEHRAPGHRRTHGVPDQFGRSLRGEFLLYAYAFFFFTGLYSFFFFFVRN